MALETSLQSILGLYSLIPQWLLSVILIWILVWKGLALWKSSHKEQPIWFVVLLVLNTLGLLEILYIFVFSKMSKKKEENKTVKKK
jgi:hypothetical protein